MLTCPRCDGPNEERPGFLCEECRAELFWEIVRFRDFLRASIVAAEADGLDATRAPGL